LLDRRGDGELDRGVGDAVDQRDLADIAVEARVWLRMENPGKRTGKMQAGSAVGADGAIAAGGGLALGEGHGFERGSGALRRRRRVRCWPW
jgi:hypothetical protein